MQSGSVATLGQSLQRVRAELSLAPGSVELPTLLNHPINVPLRPFLGGRSAPHFDTRWQFLLIVRLFVVVGYHIPDNTRQRFLILSYPRQQVLLLFGCTDRLLRIDHVFLLNEPIELSDHQLLIVLLGLFVVEPRPVHHLFTVFLFLVELGLGLGHLEVVFVLAGRFRQLATLLLYLFEHLGGALVVHYLLGDVQVELAHPVDVLVDLGGFLLVGFGNFLELLDPG